MRKSPLTIALVMAGVIAGTTAGIAAINSEVAPVAAPVALQPATEMQPQSEVQAAVETATPVAVETQPVAQAQVTAPVRSAAAPAVPAARGSDEEKMVRIPFTNYYVRVTHPTFPSEAPETPDPLPSTIAYFDRLEAATRLAASQKAPSAPTAAIELPSTAQAAPQPAQPVVQAALTAN